MPFARHQPTVMVRLPGGQSRLRQMILYVSTKCESARYFGAIKLNKIIWKADFDSFLETGLPITGREYRKQKFGPALREMVPVRREMLQDGAIRIEQREFGEGIIEERTIPLDRPDMSLFTSRDVFYVDRSISHYWEMTGMESSDQSHGVAWLTRAIGDPIPYEASILSDSRPSDSQFARLTRLIRGRELMTQ